MRYGEALATLLMAHGWLAGSGAGHPGAASAIHGIERLGGRLAERTLLAPNDNDMLVRMIVSHGRRLASGLNADRLQLGQLEEAARRAVRAASP